MTENPTLFGKILRGEIPSRRLHEDEHCIAIADIHPAAPVHLLILPRKHIPTVNDIQPEDRFLVGHMVSVAAKIAVQEGFADNGYRLIFNCGGDGGQTVFHLHLHVLAGRPMSWPPG